MSLTHRLQAVLLENRKITADEVGVVRMYLEEGGQLDLEDVKFLVELLSAADEVCPEFDDLFFPALKKVLLADGRITMDEQFYLLKMLYSDGHVRAREIDFLRELQREVTQSSPEFEQLCATALGSPETGWDVGGK